MINTIKKLFNKIQVWMINLANTFHRETVVLRTCEYHIKEIQSKTTYPMTHPLIQDLVEKTEQLDLEQRGPFLAYVTVQLEREKTLHQSIEDGFNWAWHLGD